MNIAAFDDAQAARALGVEFMCRGALHTVAAAADYAALSFEAGTMEVARAAQLYADGGALLSTPVPDLLWWERAYVRARGWLRRMAE